jgi:predicted ATP-binding protein involved in virulence
MQVNRITIKNFRNIGDEVTYRLNEKFTAIIGINGKGKSTILTAMKIAVGTYFLGIPEVPKRHIWESEIRRKDFGSYLSRVTPTVIKAEGTIDGRALEKPWTRRIPEGGLKTTSNKEDVGEIRELANNKYKAIQNGEKNIDNPVIAFLGTGRLYGPTRNTIGLGHYVGRDIFRLGYYNWSDLQYSTYNYMNWLNSHRFMVKDKRESPELEIAFYNAIKISNPYITELDYDGKELRLKVRMVKGEPETPYLPLSLHSDGVINHTGMVAELAYRCIMLNAHNGINAINNSRGVVMIDELDLHLHPNWQRHVVDDLKNAFPNIQFIVTTHSPYIVQSLDGGELINLDVIADVDPKELTVDQVSTYIMQVESEFSTQNELQFKTTKIFLDKLGDPAVDEAVLREEINSVNDPTLRAYLELNKMAKGK